ncbi:Acetyltransferase (GNAT) family protein [Amycolatopsis marina]|uniref:Acetyltransferase (GNAT) family protein n=1 Tax=Amycolatopsis marina TaxID=490629 RepID=A0A1I1C1U8_9PSEU|nr:GNAT family N-acetyltransferase [Amycolatopsis marina]SFB54533.1 Acetyltransferase (GNAT) family protein [Amycolatopsis marina]
MEIRTFAERDRAELYALFERAGEGSPTASLWGHTESEAAVYLEPYLDLAPESVFVAEIDGALAGYLTGCPDTASFPSETERMERAIRKYRLVLRAKPAAFFARSLADLVLAKARRVPTSGDFEDARWPAHLHINVEPAARGTGAAGGLMSHWLERLSETGSPGCHLQTLRENTRAVRFFRRMGFVEHGPSPLVPGIRHGSARLHQQTMVWNP